MIISISGDPGSGKSTVAKIISAKLSLNHYSMGDLRGKMAVDRNLTIDELNRLGENDSFTDTEVDEYQRELGKKEDNFIVDGRLSFYFIPHSFKVYLTVDAVVAGERIFKAPKRPDEKNYANVADVVNTTKARVESDKKRYMKYYKIDYTDKLQYDLVIDTTKLSPEEVAKNIIAVIEKNKLK